MTESAHLDYDSLDVLKDIMDDEFIPLLSVFVSDADQKIPQIQQAAKVGDAQHVRELAHSLKGASGNIHALALSSHCLALEQLALAQMSVTNPSPQLFTSAVNDVCAEYQQLRLLLNDMIATA